MILRRPLRLALVLAGSCLFSLSAGASSTNDAWLTTRVKMALLTGKDTPSMSVNVDTVRGTVTLHGKVKTEADKSRAEKVAREVDGVREVHNLLQVVPESVKESVKASDDQIKKEVADAIGKSPSLGSSQIEVKSVNRGVVLLGGTAASISDTLSALETARNVPGVNGVASEIKSPDRLADDEVSRPRPATAEHKGTGGSVRDAWITSDVKLRLMADAETPALDINVDTSNGVVTLFGIVPNAAARAAAEADARKVGEVKKVVNALQVVPKEQKKAVEAKDEEIEKEIETALKQDDSLKGSDIEVEVKQGVVRLTGEVASQGDRLSAAVAARSVAGVRSVRDELETETRAAKAGK